VSPAMQIFPAPLALVLGPATRLLGAINPI
jgi:hypothetical protein